MPPTTIQNNLLPIQRTTPAPTKLPAEWRTGERKDDFQQRLDEAEAANKPAEPKKATAKTDQAESKKPAGKVGAGGRTKRKPDGKDDTRPLTEGEAADGSASVTEAKEGQSVLEGEGETAEATASTESGEIKGKEGDGKPEGDTEDAQATADVAVLAQSASAVQPVAANPDDHPAEGEEQQGAKADGSGNALGATGIGSAKTAKGTSSTRVAAIGKEDAKGDEDGSSGDSADDPTAALADAILKVTGEGDASSTDEGTGEPQGQAAAGMKQAGKSKSATAELGLQRVADEPKPEKATATTTTPATQFDASTAAAAASQAAAVAGQPVGEEKKPGTDAAPDAAKALGSDATAAAGQAQGPQSTSAHRAANAPTPPPAPPEVQFADTNHDSIVTGVKAQLLPHGGSMQIRLDPPELGALKVMVEMRDGAMTATFQTSNEDATRLLSHSLNQLKHVLEGQGVSVERLQVQQAPRADSGSTGGNNDDPKQQQQNQNWQDEHTARQEQQRKEVLRRMWRRVSGVADPIDVTA